MFRVVSFPMHFEDILTTAPPGATGEGTEQRVRKVRPEMSISLLPAVKLHRTIRFRAHQGWWRHWRVELTGFILRRRWRDNLEGEMNIAGILHLHSLSPDTGFPRQRLVERGRIELRNSILEVYRHSEVRRDLSWAGILHMNCMLSNTEFLHGWLKAHGHVELTDLFLRRHWHKKVDIGMSRGNRCFDRVEPYLRPRR